MVLIILNVFYSSRVSVLEAFDPLICRSSSSGDDYEDDKGNTNNKQLNKK